LGYVLFFLLNIFRVHDIADYSNIKEYQLFYHDTYIITFSYNFINRNTTKNYVETFENACNKVLEHIKSIGEQWYIIVQPYVLNESEKSITLKLDELIKKYSHHYKVVTS